MMGAEGTLSQFNLSEGESEIGGRSLRALCETIDLTQNIDVVMHAEETLSQCLDSLWEVFACFMRNFLCT